MDKKREWLSGWVHSPHLISHGSEEISDGATFVSSEFTQI